MKIILIGGGKVGSAIVAQLINEGHDILVVDDDRETIDRISDNMDVMTLCGNGAEPDILREAGVEGADLVIACTATDELNALCCAFAKKLGCRNTIARIRSPQYSDQIYYFKEDFGLSMTINPELAAAREIFSLLELPSVLHRDSFYQAGVDIVEVVCRSGSFIEDMALMNIPKKFGSSFLICAVKRGDDLIIPNGRFIIKENDHIFICAPVRKIAQILHRMGENTKRCNDVMIIGGGNISEYLTDALLNAGVKVKIIEQRQERAEQLAEKFEDAVIVCADGTSEDVLLAEHLSEMDGAVMLTDRDEESLILSMYASRVGVPQVITKIGHTNFGKLFEDDPTIKIVNPQRLCAEIIVRYVRAIQNSEGSPIVSLRYIANNRIAAMEFNISENCIGLEKPLMELKFKKGILISSITRGGKVLVPGGTDVLMAGDTAIVVANNDIAILDINDIFE